VFQDKNQVMALPATPKERDGGFFDYILKTLRKRHLKPNTNLKIAAVLKILSHLL
jgi:hypothetical protein